MKYKRVYRGVTRVGDQFIGDKKKNSRYQPNVWTDCSGGDEISSLYGIIVRRPLKYKVASDAESTTTPFKMQSMSTLCAKCIRYKRACMPFTIDCVSMCSEQLQA